MSKSLAIVQMLPELESGGVERGTLEMSKHLVEHGHRSVVISGGGQMVDQLTSEGGEHIDWSVGKKSISTIRYIGKVRKLLQETKPDILHLRSRLPGWVGYLAWKKLPKKDRPKLVTTVHGQYSVGGYSSVMVRGERIIAVSETIRSYILNNYAFVDPNNITVIHRGVDADVYTSNFKPEESWVESWFSQYPQMKGKKLLTLPARITRLKGHADFISLVADVLKSDRSIHGVVVGGVHPKKKKYVEELQQKVKKLDLQTDITFVGYRNDLKEILSISEVVFSLSTTPESFGRTTLEALSIGKPVIGYCHGGVEEQLEEIFPEGLVPVGSIDAAVEKVTSWFTLPAQPAKNHSFTLENMCNSTLQLYQEICS